MILSAVVQLNPTPEQRDALARTMTVYNAACDRISEIAWNKRQFKRVGVHHLVYRDIRRDFGLGAGATCAAIGRVANEYASHKKSRISYRKYAGVVYNQNTLSWNLPTSTVSIWTIEGREKIPFSCGDRQLRMLEADRGEASLFRQNGRFYLSVTCEVDEANVSEFSGTLGVDFGVVNIAVDSDGVHHSASHINNARFRHRRLRARLQSRGTKSARRRLRALSGKERRFARDVNHTISKQIVAKAQGTGRAIALENLQGITDRVTVSRSRRATLRAWSFYQLRSFVEYKALRSGVQVFVVDPRNTSRTCPECGHIDKRNRPTQSVFKCVACGLVGQADHIAARNIASRAGANQPNAASDVQIVDLA